MWNCVLQSPCPRSGVCPAGADRGLAITSFGPGRESAAWLALYGGGVFRNSPRHGLRVI